MVDVICAEKKKNCISQYKDTKNQRNELMFKCRHRNKFELK